jgi:hypothetical protein
MTDPDLDDPSFTHVRLLGNQAYLAWLARTLETAPRLGALPGAPAGLRVLQLSDKLARLIAARLRRICEVL